MSHRANMTISGERGYTVHGTRGGRAGLFTIYKFHCRFIRVFKNEFLNGLKASPPAIAKGGALICDGNWACLSKPRMVNY